MTACSCHIEIERLREELELVTAERDGARIGKDGMAEETERLRRERGAARNRQARDVKDMHAAYEQRDEAFGAMRAQDERERLAGDKCGVSALEHGCDWPDAVAERLMQMRNERDRLRGELDEALAKLAQRTGVDEGAVSRALCAVVPIPDEGDGVSDAEVRDFLSPGIHSFNNERAIMRAALMAGMKG